MKTLGTIFGKSTHLKLLSIFYNDQKGFYNLSELARMLEKSNVTTRKVVSELVEVGVLAIENMGIVRVVSLNLDGKYTEELILMMDKMQALDEGDVITKLIARRR